MNSNYSSLPPIDLKRKLVNKTFQNHLSSKDGLHRECKLSYPSTKFVSRAKKVFPSSPNGNCSSDQDNQVTGLFPSINNHNAHDESGEFRNGTCHNRPSNSPGCLTDSDAGTQDSCKTDATSQALENSRVKLAFIRSRFMN